ncbi:hypothetical protein [Mycobacterium sp. NPDC050041]|uniref:hypothetical protein n=1 Tax=Mycobacterium sp. NPDC050041 TaxID=3364293 RepID=UPI003C2B7E1C
MSTTLLIPSVGALCVAVAAMLLPAGSRRPAGCRCAEAPAESEERLISVDEIDTVCAAFDQMLIDKGLLTTDQFDTIRRGTRSRGVVTAMRTTGEAREDYREVELDLMVSRRDGGQFPVQETTLVPASSLDRVSPGSVIVTYYRDESSVAVCVPPA